jgi:hypothetical protein
LLRARENNYKVIFDFLDCERINFFLIIFCELLYLNSKLNILLIAIALFFTFLPTVTAESFWPYSSAPECVGFTVPYSYGLGQSIGLSPNEVEVTYFVQKYQDNEGANAEAYYSPPECFLNYGGYPQIILGGGRLSNKAVLDLTLKKSDNSYVKISLEKDSPNTIEGFYKGVSSFAVGSPYTSIPNEQGIDVWVAEPRFCSCPNVFAPKPFRVKFVVSKMGSRINPNVNVIKGDFDGSGIVGDAGDYSIQFKCQLELTFRGNYKNLSDCSLLDVDGDGKVNGTERALIDSVKGQRVEQTIWEPLVNQEVSVTLSNDSPTGASGTFVLDSPTTNSNGEVTGIYYPTSSRVPGETIQMTVKTLNSDSFGGNSGITTSGFEQKVNVVVPQENSEGGVDKGIGGAGSDIGDTDITPSSETTVPVQLSCGKNNYGVDTYPLFVSATGMYVGAGKENVVEKLPLSGKTISFVVNSQLPNGRTFSQKILGNETGGKKYEQIPGTQNHIVTNFEKLSERYVPMKAEAFGFGGRPIGGANRLVKGLYVCVPVGDLSSNNAIGVGGSGNSADSSQKGARISVTANHDGYFDAINFSVDNYLKLKVGDDLIVNNSELTNPDPSDIPNITLKLRKGIYVQLGDGEGKQTEGMPVAIKQINTINTKPSNGFNSENIVVSNPFADYVLRNIGLLSGTFNGLPLNGTGLAATSSLSEPGTYEIGFISNWAGSTATIPAPNSNPSTSTTGTGTTPSANLTSTSSTSSSNTSACTGPWCGSNWSDSSGINPSGSGLNGGTINSVGGIVKVGVFTLLQNSIVRGVMDTAVSGQTSLMPGTKNYLDYFRDVVFNLNRANEESWNIVKVVAKGTTFGCDTVIQGEEAEEGKKIYFSSESDWSEINTRDKRANYTLNLNEPQINSKFSKDNFEILYLNDPIKFKSGFNPRNSDIEQMLTENPNAEYDGEHIVVNGFQVLINDTVSGKQLTKVEILSEDGEVLYSFSNADSVIFLGGTGADINWGVSPNYSATSTNANRISYGVKSAIALDNIYKKANGKRIFAKATYTLSDGKKECRLSDPTILVPRNIPKPLVPMVIPNGDPLEQLKNADKMLSLAVHSNNFFNTAIFTGGCTHPTGLNGIPDLDKCAAPLIVKNNSFTEGYNSSGINDGFPKSENINLSPSAVDLTSRLSAFEEFGEVVLFDDYDTPIQAGNPESIKLMHRAALISSELTAPLIFASELRNVDNTSFDMKGMEGKIFYTLTSGLKLSDAWEILLKEIDKKNIVAKSYDDLKCKEAGLSGNVYTQNLFCTPFGLSSSQLYNLNNSNIRTRVIDFSSNLIFADYAQKNNSDILLNVPNATADWSSETAWVTNGMVKPPVVNVVYNSLDYRPEFKLSSENRLQGSSSTQNNSIFNAVANKLLDGYNTSEFFFSILAPYFAATTNANLNDISDFYLIGGGSTAGTPLSGYDQLARIDPNKVSLSKTGVVARRLGVSLAFNDDTEYFNSAGELFNAEGTPVVLDNLNSGAKIMLNELNESIEKENNVGRDIAIGNGSLVGGQSNFPCNSNLINGEKVPGHTIILASKKAFPSGDERFEFVGENADEFTNNSLLEDYITSYQNRLADGSMGLSTMDCTVSSISTRYNTDASVLISKYLLGEDIFDGVGQAN